MQSWSGRGPLNRRHCAVIITRPLERLPVRPRRTVTPVGCRARYQSALHTGGPGRAILTDQERLRRHVSLLASTGI
jgi:hypothetical protein